MDRAQAYEKVTEIFRDIFEDDEIVLSDETTAKDIEGWDSLTHLSLINEIEMAFDIRFKLAEVQKSKNVGELITALLSHVGE
ncbi:MAG: acyl carrier protein [Lachnospiraceae bacterium]|nr:acyl carrier protein [Lachnospiraceae bacterium]